MNFYPIGKNMVEAWMVQQIFEREMAAIHKRQYKKFLLVVLAGATTGCSVQAAPRPPVPVAPFVCFNTPVRVMTLKADGSMSPVMALDTAICACSDRVVRTCQ